MPRRSRLIYPGAPLHIIQRGNNRQSCFFADEDYIFYLDWLQEYAKFYNCTIHAFVLMTNHVHILLTPKKENSAGDLMKRLGQRYVQYINRIYKRSGTLWDGRFHSCIVQQEYYLLSWHACYLELTPVRAGMVEHPGEYTWSSYGSNTQGESNEVLTLRPVYAQLGNTNDKKYVAYRELFRFHLEPEIIKV